MTATFDTIKFYRKISKLFEPIMFNKFFSFDINVQNFKSCGDNETSITAYVFIDSDYVSDKENTLIVNETVASYHSVTDNHKVIKKLKQIAKELTSISNENELTKYYYKVIEND